MRIAMNPLISPRLLAAAAALALSFTLAACGSDDTGTDTAGSAATAGVDSAHNDADAAFVTGMVPHHEGAVEMSELAATRAASDEVKALAERIAAAQGPEIEQLTAMAQAWDVDLDGGGAHAGGHSTEMPDDVAALEPLSGSAFDKEFLTRMIEHHEGALVMAEAEVEEGTNPEAKELAQKILAAQKAEITEMEQMLTRV